MGPLILVLLLVFGIPQSHGQRKSMKQWEGFINKFMNHLSLDSLEVISEDASESFWNFDGIREQLGKRKFAVTNPRASLPSDVANRRGAPGLKFVPEESDFIDIFDAYSGSRDVWCFVASNSSGLKARLEKSDVAFDSRVFVVGDKENVEIFEVYRLNDGVQVLKYGMWNPKKGLSVMDSRYVWDRRTNMNGALVRVGTVVNPPFVTKAEEGCNSADCFQGIYAEIWDIMATRMNFTYTVSLPKDAKIGARNAKGQWDGLMGMVMHEEVDVAIGGILKTKQAQQAFDMTFDLLQTHHMFFIKNPQDNLDFMTYMRPMRWEVWVGIALCLLIIPHFLTIVQSYGNQDRWLHHYNLLRSYVATYGGYLTQRGWHIAPWTHRGRIVFGVITVNGILTFYHWEASMIAFMGTRKIVYPFSNAEELLRDTDLKVLVQSGTDLALGFKNSPDPVLRKIYEERMEPVNRLFSSDLDELIGLLNEGHVAKYTLYSEVRTMWPKEAYESCQIVAVPEKREKLKTAFAFRKGFKFFPAFDYYVKKLKELGTLTQIADRHYYNNDPQVCTDRSGKALGFSNTFTAFVFFGMGIVAAVFIYFVEVFVRDFGYKELMLKITRSPDEVYPKANTEYARMEWQLMDDIVGYIAERDLENEYFLEYLRRLKRRTTDDIPSPPAKSPYFGLNE